MSADLGAEITRRLSKSAADTPLPGETDRLESEKLQLASEVATRVRQWRPEGELRAAASVWSKHLFGLLVLPRVRAQCRSGSALVPTGTMLLVQDQPARWAELRLIDGPAHPVDFLSPWVDALAQSTGVRPRVLWSNIGNHLEALLQRLTTEVPDIETALDERRGRWLQMPRWENRRNPLYRPVVYREGRRLRRVCCLRYRFADLKYCSTCPCPEAGQ